MLGLKVKLTHLEPQGLNAFLQSPELQIPDQFLQMLLCLCSAVDGKNFRVGSVFFHFLTW